MKKALVMMALIVSSVSAHAEISVSAKITGAPFVTTIATTLGTGMMSSGWSLCKEARQIIAEGEEYTLTGQLAPYLNQSVEILQAESDDLSTDEAVDLLVEKAVSILK